MPMSSTRCLLAVLMLAPALWWTSGVTGAPATHASDGPVRLQPHNTDARDLFGGAVALSRNGRVLAVGADLESSGQARDSDDNSLPGAGAVYVFERDGQRWREAAYLKAPVPAGGAGFGFSVALADDGQTLAVGAPFEPGEGAGAVHVYRRADGVWVPVAALRAPEGVQRFGEQVVLSGRAAALAVSAAQGEQAVEAHVFTAEGDHWTPAARLLHATAGRGGAAPAPRLAMSGDGRRIALGHRASARVQLFEVGPLGWSSASTRVLGMPHDEAAAVQALSLSADGRLLAVGGADGRVAMHAQTDAAGWAPGALLDMPATARGIQGLALSDDGQTLVVGAADAGRAGGTGLAMHRYQQRSGRWYGPSTLASPHASGPSSGAALALSGDGATLAVGRRFEAAPPPWPWLSAPRPGAGAVHLYSPS